MSSCISNVYAFGWNPPQITPTMENRAGSFEWLTRFFLSPTHNRTSAAQVSGFLVHISRWCVTLGLKFLLSNSIPSFDDVLGSTKELISPVIWAVWVCCACVSVHVRCRTYSSDIKPIIYQKVVGNASSWRSTVGRVGTYQSTGSKSEHVLSLSDFFFFCWSFSFFRSSSIPEESKRSIISIIYHRVPSWKEQSLDRHTMERKCWGKLSVLYSSEKRQCNGWWGLYSEFL